MHDKTAQCVSQWRTRSIKRSLSTSSEQQAFRHATEPGSAETHPEENLAWHCRTPALKNWLGSQPLSGHPESETFVPLSAHSCYQHCRSQMVPGYRWVAYFISDLVYLGCTAAEERFRKQFTGDLHSKPQNPVRMIRVCLPCSHCCVQRQL